MLILKKISNSPPLFRAALIIWVCVFAVSELTFLMNGNGTTLTELPELTSFIDSSYYTGNHSFGDQDVKFCSCLFVFSSCLFVF